MDKVGALCAEPRFAKVVLVKATAYGVDGRMLEQEQRPDCGRRPCLHDAVCKAARLGVQKGRLDRIRLAKGTLNGG